MLGRGKKDAAAWAAHATGALRVALRARGGFAPRILAYHRVWDIDDESRFPWDPELVSCGVEEFAWQMRWIARHMDPVPLATVIDALEGRGRLPARAVVVTFDDGHRDNYTHAFPVLRETGVPATVFLSTDYMDSGRTFWFDRVAHQLHATDRPKVAIASLGLAFALAAPETRRRAADETLAAMKRVPEAVRLAALDELQTAAGVADGAQGSGALSWAEVAAMRASGLVAFGSHTASHPILSRLDEAQIREELGRSHAELVARDLGDADVLAYPVGGDEAYDERVVRIARECGYRLGISYTPGVSRFPFEDAFRVRRLHVERYTTRARFAAMLALPEVFAS
ncbi:MAG: polysaccharide deacetylase family protein [Betaproteobacteria bacterium]|nr:polysaccharide deacetylase family protein [Betaproteobacteria bacterium]